jgi:hypothetical protein
MLFGRGWSADHFAAIGLFKPGWEKLRWGIIPLL